MGSPDSVAGRDPSPVSLTLVAIVLAVVAGFVDAVSDAMADRSLCGGIISRAAV